MRKQIMAGILVLAMVGITGHFQTKVLADTTITEEELEDTAEDVEEAEISWQINQKLDGDSCKQGKDVTLTVSLAGDTKSMKLSTVFVRLQYDPGVFEISAENVVPVQSGSVDYISFDEDSGELDIYYANDINFEGGTDLLKIRLHVLSDAEPGKAKVGVEALELYASDSDNYAVAENKSMLSVTIKEGSSAVLLGDVNLDKKINLTDVKLIMKYCNGGTKLTSAQKKNADVNQDGKVNLTDANLVMKYCNGAIKKF